MLTNVISLMQNPSQEISLPEGHSPAWVKQGTLRTGIFSLFQPDSYISPYKMCQRNCFWYCSLCSYIRNASPINLGAHPVSTELRWKARRWQTLTLPFPSQKVLATAKLWSQGGSKQKYCQIQLFKDPPSKQRAQICSAQQLCHQNSMHHSAVRCSYVIGTAFGNWQCVAARSSEQLVPQCEANVFSWSIEYLNIFEYIKKYSKIFKYFQKPEIFLFKTNQIFRLRSNINIVSFLS